MGYFKGARVREGLLTGAVLAGAGLLVAIVCLSATDDASAFIAALVTFLYPGALLLEPFSRTWSLGYGGHYLLYVLNPLVYFFVGFVLGAGIKSFRYAAFLSMLLAAGVTGSEYLIEAFMFSGGPRPGDRKTLAGDYFTGDGLGYNLRLALLPDGAYTAEWHGCLGKYGDASGTWNLLNRHIDFYPSNETGMMKGHLRKLRTRQFKGKWVLIPMNERWRFYDRWEVSRLSCFQRKNPD